MKFDAAVAQPRRRAALVLHGLGAADCEWILAQLPAHECEDLRALLAELRALGIPSDPGIVHDALECIDRPKGRPDDDLAVAACSNGAIVAVLHDAPQAMQVACICAFEAERRDQLAAQLSLPVDVLPDMRARVQAGAAHALRQAIQAELAERVAASQPSEALLR